MQPAFAALVVLILGSHLCFPDRVSANSRSDLQRELRRIYAGKLLSLRAPSGFDIIHFDSQGKPTRSSNGEPWTMCGLLKVKKLYVHSNQMGIDGERAVVVLNPEPPGKKLLLVTLERAVHVTIDLPASVENVEQMNAFLARIFLPGDLQERIATAWTSRTDLTGDLDQIGKTLPDGRVGTLAGDRPVYLVNAGSLIKPVAIYKPEPRYSEKALFKRVFGTIRVRVVVNERGFPEIVEVIEHLREGLDSRALAAVSQWRFQPALKDGNPVAAMVVVEIKFHLR
jgi:TonB family protein